MALPRSDEMTAFVAVVQAGGFSAAAAKIGISPSAVSKLIARLEKRLGVRLLHRTTRRIGPTPEGETYFQRAQRIVAEIDEADAEAGRQGLAPRGLLRVNTSVAFGTYQLAPLLPDFLRAFPEIKLELSLEDRFVDLVAEGHDIGIRTGRMADSSLMSRHLGDAYRIICAAPSYIAKHGMPTTPEQLARHNCLGFSNQPQLNRWPLRLGSGVAPIDVAGNFAANNGDQIFQMAIAGLGLMRLATFVAAPAIKDGRLVEVLGKFNTREPLPVYAVWPAHRFQPPKIRAFVDFLVARFLPDPPWTRLDKAKAARRRTKR